MFIVFPNLFIMETVVKKNNHKKGKYKIRLTLQV